MLALRRRWLEPIADELYTEIGIRSFGKGIFHKTPVTGLELGNKRVLRIEPGDLVFNIVFAWEGAVAVAGQGDSGTIGSHRFLTFTPIEGNCDVEFVRWFFITRAGREILLRSSPGSAGRNRTLNIADLSNQRISFPALAEQQRIVGRISNAVSLVLNARELRGRSVLLREAASAAVKDRLVTNLQERQTPLVPLGAVSEIRSGVTLGRKLSGPAEFLPYLRVANVQSGYLDLTEVKSTPILPQEKAKWLLEPGDLLVTEGGDWDKLGRSAVWNGEIKDCIHQNHIFRVRVDQAEFDPYYLAFLANAPYGRRYFQDAAKQTTNLASINQRQLRSFPVFRLPLETQQALVAHLRKVNTILGAMRRVQEQSLVELDALLPAILDRAFKGEL